MRALHIITGLGVGGAEQQLRLMLRHLPVDCDVVTLTNPGAVAEGLAADGVRVTHLGMGGNRDLAALPRLVRLIRTGRYDLVHTHLYRACVYEQARRARRRGPGDRRHRALPGRLADGGPQADGGGSRAVPRQRAARFGDGRRLLDGGRPSAALGVPAPRIEVVPNGIDLDRFRFDPERREHTHAAARPAGGRVGRRRRR